MKHPGHWASISVPTVEIFPSELSNLSLHISRVDDDIFKYVIFYKHKYHIIINNDIYSEQNIQKTKLKKHIKYT